MNKDFKLWKKQSLTKLDKSPKGSIDEKIKLLCTKINEKEFLFTLSTCSGRISLLERPSGKKQSKWIYTTHDFAKYKELKQLIDNIENKKNIWFRQESVILHICCENIDIAKKVINIAKQSGFNQCGIISLRKITIEIICDATIICPIENINDKYLKTLIKQANKNQKISWKSIEKLEKSFKYIY